MDGVRPLLKTIAAIVAPSILVRLIHSKRPHDPPHLHTFSLLI